MRTLLFALILATAHQSAYAQTSQPLPLSLSDAIDRGLQYNFSILSGVQEQRAATNTRLRALYELYPKLNAEAYSRQEQINLAVFGLGAFPNTPQVIGPFALLDARAFLTQTVYDRKLLYELKEAQQNERAATFANENTRELVVVTIANLYLQALSGESRIAAIESQITRAKALYDRAVDLNKAGMIAGIEVLRAQVELQNEQQRRLAAVNDFEQQKLTLKKAIGIPLAQPITFADRMPSETPPVTTLETALQTAQEQRPDLKRAESLMRSAQHAIDAARSEQLPVLDFAADYGVIGRTPGQSHGTYTMTGIIKVPIFNGNHGKTDLGAARTLFEQRRLESEDLKSRVELEVRTAYLDLQSSLERLRVAQSSLELAHKQLDQAQDRFEAGVATNLEVVQAQEAVALSDESIISNLYTLNVAKARLARATGDAERMIKAFLGGKQ